MNKRIVLPWAVLMMFMMSCTDNNSDQNQEVGMKKIKTVDLTGFPDAPPAQPVHLLFIHHSTGGQLLADKGSDAGTNCIYKSNPNGGGLRRLLQGNNYIVHEASYGSIIGDKTDIWHWRAKFRDHMEQILTCTNQDEFFKGGERNRVVMFKSCFPNSYISSDGTSPGNPDSPEPTLANYKATYNALLEYFAKQPGTLFVVVTAPPLAQPKGSAREMVKTLLNRPDTVKKVGPRVRYFNNWLKDAENGWLKDYKLENVVVFDYYDVLTGHGQSNWSLFPTNGGVDSHPSSEGNVLAAKEFIPFINKAMSRMAGKP